MIFFFNIWRPAKESPIYPVTYISSLSLALFLKTIFFAKPIEVIVNDVLLENVVSPPESFRLNFLSSSLIDLDNLVRCILLNIFLLPEPEININLGLTPFDIRSDIDDLIIFFINKSGDLLLRK